MPKDPHPPFPHIKRALDALIQRQRHYVDEAQKHENPTRDLMRSFADDDRASIDRIRAWLGED